SRERPEPRGEPGIQNIRVLHQRLSTTLRTPIGSLPRHDGLSVFHENGFAAAGFDDIRSITAHAIPGRDLVAPPDLPGYAPVLDIFHPGEIGVAPPLGNDANPAAADDLHRGLGQRFDVYEPLRREIRLDHRLAAVAMANRMPMGLDLFQIAPFL